MFVSSIVELNFCFYKDTLKSLKVCTKSIDIRCPRKIVAKVVAQEFLCLYLL